MSVIANRYAEAFFSLALDKKSIDKYKGDLQTIKEALADVASVKDFFSCEKISKFDKKNLLDNTFKDKVSDDAVNLLKLLVDKGRIIYYEEIIDEYIHLANEQLNIKEGIIESVRPIDKEKVKQLEKLLSKDGDKVVLKQKINKSLISGFKITFDNHVIDASMKEKISNLKEVLSRKDGNLWN